MGGPITDRIIVPVLPGDLMIGRAKSGLRALREDRGAGYVEYVLIVSLAAIALITATRIYQEKIELIFSRAAVEIQNNFPGTGGN
ncbi:MAG: hypothetical protein CME06_08560 [Gemmatimonadetes bacterium]|nr:hypothetical protein [Gemmatimonadota bacterium]